MTTGRLPLSNMSEQFEQPAGGSKPAEERTAPDAPGPAAPHAIPAEPAQMTPAAEGTGDDRVDQAITRLTELDATPVHEHAAVVEAIHRSLQDTLAEDEG